jgi:hypothetical protein
VKRIIRLNPRGWRERYGEEMDDLLDERPMGPFELIDLILGAIDAHLHLRGLGNYSEHRKGFTMSLRTAGSAAIIGGAVWGLTWVLVAAGEIAGGDGGMPIAFLTILIAAAAILVALAGLSAYQARVHRVAIWVSFLVPAMGILALMVGFGGIWLGDAMYWLGLLAFIAGSILFGAVTFVTAALSRSAAAMLAGGSAVQLVGFTIMFAVADWSSPVQYVAILGMTAGSVGWVALGLDAVRRDRLPTTSRPAAA